MKTQLKSILIATLAALTLFAAAPAANAQRGQGRGMFGRGGGGAVMLLQRKDVQKDLKLTDKQISDLTALQEKMRAEMTELFQSAGAGGDRAAMQKTMQEKFTQMGKDANAILTPEQQTRLKEINIQFQGNAIILDPEIQTKLKITDDQKAKIKDLQDKQQEASTGLREKVRNQEMSPEEFQAANKKNTETMNVELGKILTDDQKKMLADMSGKKFDRDPDENPGFGGRPGGL